MGDGLTTLALQELDEACRPIRDGFGETPYLVGTALERGGHRDVDVRLILDDAEFDRLFVGRPAFWGLLCRAFTTYLRSRTGLPIDFQIQRQTEANAKHAKPRNPLGVRTVVNYAGGGDGTPPRPA